MPATLVGQELNQITTVQPLPLDQLLRMLNCGKRVKNLEWSVLAFDGNNAGDSYVEIDITDPNGQTVYFTNNTTFK